MHFFPLSVDEMTCKCVSCGPRGCLKRIFSLIRCCFQAGTCGLLAVPKLKHDYQFLREESVCMSTSRLGGCACVFAA